MCKKSLEKEPFEWDGEGRSVYVQRRQVGGLGWDRQRQGHQPEQKARGGGRRETRPTSDRRTQQILGLLTSFFLKLVTLDKWERQRVGRQGQKQPDKPYA